MDTQLTPQQSLQAQLLELPPHLSAAPMAQWLACVQVSTVHALELQFKGKTICQKCAAMQKTREALMNPALRGCSKNFWEPWHTFEAW